jgi:hypothetical protein
MGVYLVRWAFSDRLSVIPCALLLNETSHALEHRIFFTCIRPKILTTHDEVVEKLVHYDSLRKWIEQGVLVIHADETAPGTPQFIYYEI